MERLQAQLDRVAGGASNASESGIVLVTGVPGVGKTELTRRFLAHANSDGDNTRQTLTLSASALSSPLTAFLRIAGAVGRGAAGRVIAEVDTSVSQRSVGGAGLRVGVSKDRERVRHHFSELLALLGPAWPKQCAALVVRIDELQNAAPQSAEVLKGLHEGIHGCPIMTLGAGLQHTPSVLAELGISRLAPPLELDVLSDAETLEAISENLTHYGVANTSPASLQALAAASFGFPVHIHGYLEAAVQVTMRRGQGALDDQNVLADVIQQGDAARTAYYEGRLDSMALNERRDPRAALVPIVAAITRSPDESGFLLQEDAERLCHREPYEGAQVVQQAVVHGVLTRKSGTVGFGIPSFRNHMVGFWREYERQRAGKEPQAR